MTVFRLVASYLPLRVKLGRLTRLSRAGLFSSPSTTFTAACFAEDHLELTASTVEALIRSPLLRGLLARVRSISMTCTLRNPTSCDRIVQAFALAASDHDDPLLPGLQIAIVELLVDVPDDATLHGFGAVREQALAAAVKLIGSLNQCADLMTLSLTIRNPAGIDLESFTDDTVVVALTSLRNLRTLRLGSALSLRGLRHILSLPLHHLDLFPSYVADEYNFRDERNWPAAGGQLTTLLLPWSDLHWDALMRAARLQLTHVDQGGEQHIGLRHLRVGRWSGPADLTPFLSSFHSLTALELEPLQDDITTLDFLLESGPGPQPRLPALTHLGYYVLCNGREQEADRLSTSIQAFLRVYGAQLSWLRIAVVHPVSRPAYAVRLFNQSQQPQPAAATRRHPNLHLLHTLHLGGIALDDTELVGLLSSIPQLVSLTLESMEGLALGSLVAIGRAAPGLQRLRLLQASQFMFVSNAEGRSAADITLGPPSPPCLQQLRLLEIKRCMVGKSTFSLKVLTWLVSLLAHHTTYRFAALHLDVPLQLEVCRIFAPLDSLLSLGVAGIPSMYLKKLLPRSHCEAQQLVAQNMFVADGMPPSGFVAELYDREVFVQDQVFQSPVGGSEWLNGREAFFASLGPADAGLAHREHGSAYVHSLQRIND